MCDFMSWIKVGKKLYWLEDDIIEAKGWALEDAIGHSAIENYYGIDGEHYENWQKVPVQIAKRINDGHMDKMARVFGIAGVRYDAKGKIKNDWWLKAQKFIKDIKDVKWFDNHGEIKENWKVFDTYEAAYSATGSATYSAAESAAYSAAKLAAYSAARLAAYSAAESAARVATRLAAYPAAGSAAYSAARVATRLTAYSAAESAARVAARLTAGSAAESAVRLAARSATAIVSEDPVALDFFEKVWEIWKSGYGYMWDMDGIFYVYKGF